MTDLTSIHVQMCVCMNVLVQPQLTVYILYITVSCSGCESFQCVLSKQKLRCHLLCIDKT